MKARKNPLIKLRNWFEHDASNFVKDWTGNDLFDWLNLFVIFGGGSFAILICVVLDILDPKDAIQAFILWFTAFVIIRYTKETYWLKQIAQKQIEIEQEPYVVVDGLIVLVGTGRHEITLKNVGRGSALRVTCSIDWRNRDEAFFEDIKPHAYYLSMNDSITSLISETAIGQIKNNTREGFHYFYISYKSQLGKLYFTKVKLKLLSKEFVVMENQRQENKAG